MEMLLTVEQAAERLQLAPFTVREQLKRGKLRGIKRGRVWRVPESALFESSSQNEPRVTMERSAESPLARALALVAQLESEMQNAPQRVGGVDDAATEIRAMREERTP